MAQHHSGSDRRHPASGLSLKQKLPLFLLTTVLAVLLVVGLSLDFLITNYYRDEARSSSEDLFAEVDAHLGTLEANVARQAQAVAERDNIIASVNMVVRYATADSYEPLIYDVEKRALAQELGEQVRAGGIGQAALYDRDGRVLAFYTAGDGQTEAFAGYFSYEEGEPVLVRGEAAPPHDWKPADKLPHSLQARFVPTYEELSSPIHRRCKRGFLVESVAPVLRSYPGGEREVLGYVVASGFVINGFAESYAKRVGLDFALLFDNGQHLGGLAQLGSITLEKGAVPLLASGRSLRLEDEKHFLFGRRLPLSGGESAYAVVGITKQSVTEAVANTRWTVGLVLLIAGFVVVPAGVLVAHRSVSAPVASLLAGVEAIERGDYGRRVAFGRGDELGRLAEAFNGMAGAIQRRETALVESENKYRTLVENLPQRIFLKGPDQRYISCNARYSEDMGVAPEQIAGKTDFDFFAPELAEKYRDDDRRIMHSGTIEELEERYTAHGEEFIIHTVKTPLYDQAGDVNGILGIFWDVTDRKRTEDQLRQSAAVFESTAEGVMITDTELRIVRVNKAFTEISGYSEAEVLGRKPSVRRSQRQGREFYQAMWNELNASGRWQGEIWNRRKSGEVYPEWMTINTVRDAQGAVTHYVAVFSDISTIKKSQEKLDHLAYHDPLTDLPNRVLLSDRITHALERARRTDTMAGVLFLDLDRFKNVNDSLGHPVGDRLLQSVAGRLRMRLRAEDTVARLGGDEFVVLVEEMAEVQEAEQVAEKILGVFRQPFLVDDSELYLGASIGISVFPNDGRDAAELVKNADAAMYRAKERGRNTFQFYTAELTTQALERIELEAALRQALERREFVLYFQPQIDLSSGSMVGAEALVRWYSDGRLVPPDRFIPITEENGLIIPLGEWILEQACETAKQWRRLDAGFERMSVNLSGVQIERGDLLDTVSRVLARTGLPAAALELEITESVLMTHPEQVIGVLDGLRELGVTLAVDDFGTGYSSLSYLKRFPIGCLKIDKSFVQDIPSDDNDMAITQAVIALAQSLKIEVVAEGVETAEQAVFLQGEGCERAQGYHYSRPVPAEEFANVWMPAASPNRSP